MQRIIKPLTVAALAAALALPAAAQELKPQTLKMANVVPEGSWFGRQLHHTVSRQRPLPCAGLRRQHR